MSDEIDSTDNVLDNEIQISVPVPNPDGVSDMAMTGETHVDLGILNVSLSGLATEATSAAARRVNRFDQLGADSASMWAVALTSPTVSAAIGYRTATESGAGRTRLEANRPTETGAAGGP